MNLAGSADNASIIVDDYRLCSFEPCDFLRFEDGNWAYCNTNAISVAFGRIDRYCYHPFTPLLVGRRGAQSINE